MDPIDTLISPRWLVPVEPHGVALENYSVAVSDGRIVAVLPNETALQRFLPAQTIELPQHALMPGLINLHTHASMTLMRGLADDLSLMRWLKEHIWPAEARHVSPEFVYDGTLIACAEMLRGGVTCMNDMYFFPEAAARAVSDSGMRATIGIIAIEFPTAYASDPDDYIAKGLSTRDAFKGNPLIGFSMAPHAPYTVSDRTFEKIVTIAEELDLPVHLHLHETLDEIRESVAAHGHRPLERIRRLGLLGPRLIAVHSVHLQPDEIDMLALHGCSVAHCPSSNLKLASGFAPVAALLAKNVNLGLGTDGAASNNRLDMFQEMRTAALLAKAVSNDPEAMPGAQAIHAATLGGAKALGLDAEIGSIVPGKSADLTAVRLAGPELSPCFDPISHLVYAAGRENVTHVWVAGSLLVSERQFLTLDEADLDNRAGLWQNQLALETKAY